MTHNDADFLSLLGDHLAIPEDKTRDRIVMTAKRRFLDEGFSRVTIGDLCHQLRISKKTFYKFFSDKEDLILAILATNIKVFLPRLTTCFDNALPVRERFDNFMNFITGDFRKNITVAFIADLQALMPEVWEAIDKFRKFQFQRFVELIKEGQEEGVFRKEVDADILSKFFMLVVSKVMDPKILYEAGLQIHDIANMWFSIMDKGLHVSPEEKEGGK